MVNTPTVERASRVSTVAGSSRPLWLLADGFVEGADEGLRIISRLRRLEMGLGCARIDSRLNAP